MALDRHWFVAAVLVAPLAGCEYSGPPEIADSSAPQTATVQPASLQENIGKVARLLGTSMDAPGMPSEAEPAGQLSLDLAPGDYTVQSACAGAQNAKLTITGGEDAPLTVPYTCDSILERFVRHPGGPLTISAGQPHGKPAAAGVAIQPNMDPRAAELEDLREWSARQLTPDVPGQSAGSTSSNSATSFGLSAAPGSYEAHFVCAGPPEVQLSVTSVAGAKVLAPVQVPCSGEVFTAPVELASEGADFRMDPGGGAHGRYAFRLIPKITPPARAGEGR